MKNNMEDKNLKNGIEEIRKIKMTSIEKEQMLKNVLGYSVVQKQKSVQSSWFGYSFMLKIHRNQLAYYMVIPLIIVLTSGGVVFASQESLPDSILYPIKTKVVEPVIGALNFSTKSKAKYESSLATERLVEAETLASLGQLDAEKEQKLNNLLAKHTDNLNKNLEKMNEDNPSEQVDEIVTSFQAEMKAHARVLEMIHVEEKNKSSKQVSSSKISNNARFNANKVKNNSESKEDKKEENISDKYAKRKKSVDTLINSTTTNINQVSTAALDINQEIVDDTNQTINEAKQFFDEAIYEENEGNQEEAYNALLESESSAKEAGIFLETGLRFKNR